MEKLITSGFRWIWTIVFLVAFANQEKVIAHARLTRSVPASESKVSMPVKKVELWFNEILEERFNKIEIYRSTEGGKGRENLAKGEPQLDQKDRTHLVMETTPLKPGEYIVEYRVLSRDGHTAPGRIRFEVLEEKK
jgi:methionine-rich copper-binding protein CopC